MDFPSSVLLFSQTIERRGNFSEKMRNTRVEATRDRGGGQMGAY